ncbi:MAG: hypothetical protein WCE49_01155, partial [Terrimicrobiaceae bacterium]
MTMILQRLLTGGHNKAAHRSPSWDLLARRVPLAQMGSAIQPQTSPRRWCAGDPGGVFWIVGSTDHHLSSNSCTPGIGERISRRRALHAGRFPRSSS